MAFDVTNQADLTALKNEVEGHVSYSPDDNVTVILQRLNDAALNAGGETGVPPLTTDSLMGVLWTNTTATQLEFSLGLLFSMSASPDEDISRHRASIIAEANVGLTTDINALSRDLSRAEVLFAGLDDNGSTEFVTISNSDWIAARENG
jgi:hypothetical protein